MLIEGNRQFIIFFVLLILYFEYFKIRTKHSLLAPSSFLSFSWVFRLHLLALEAFLQKRAWSAALCYILARGAEAWCSNWGHLGLWAEAQGQTAPPLHEPCGMHVRPADVSRFPEEHHQPLLAGAGPDLEQGAMEASPLGY